MPGDLARVNPSESVRPASPASDFGMHLYFLQLLDWPIVGTVASGVVAGMMQFRSCGCFYALGRVVDRTAVTTYARFSGDAACHFSLGRNSWWIHARAIPDERPFRSVSTASWTNYPPRSLPSGATLRSRRDLRMARCADTRPSCWEFRCDKPITAGRSAPSTAACSRLFSSCGSASTGAKTCVSV